MIIISILDNFRSVKPFVFEKHMLFLDVSEFNMQNPIYVSIVRNPIDRLSSWYYYQRSSLYLHGVYFSNVMDAKRSFEDCVTGMIGECTFEIGIDIFDDN